jgi:hypothetical protein
LAHGGILGRGGNTQFGGDDLTDALTQWKQENKWLLLTDHFGRHMKVKNDLHTFAGICNEIDTTWDEIIFQQMWIDYYINECDLQNILYTKYEIDRLKAWLSKLELKLKYKLAFLKGELNGMEQAMIDRARDYPMEQILENYGCKVRHNRCACPVHKGGNPTSFSIKDNRGYCHCGFKGDSIALYQALHGVNFKTAVKELQG